MPPANRILVVEDDGALRETLRLMLELDGYDVVTAANGLDGLERLQAGVQLVVCDLMMPRLDGFGFAAELERQGLRQQVKLLVLTADGRAEANAKRIGADAWLEKPFELTELLDKVARLAESTDECS